MKKISFTEAAQLLSVGMKEYYHFATHNAIINDHQWLLSLLGEKLMGKNPEIDPHKHAQLIVNNIAKAVQQRKDSLFNIWYWSKWASTGNKQNLTLHFKLCTKINSKCITDFNVKCKPIKVVQKKNTGENLQDLGQANSSYT